MSELHTFLFEGLPVRGMLVRLTESWVDLLARAKGDREARVLTGKSEYVAREEVLLPDRQSQRLRRGRWYRPAVCSFSVWSFSISRVSHRV